MSKKEPLALTEEQKKQIITIPNDDLLRVFKGPGWTRAWLKEQKKKALAELSPRYIFDAESLRQAQLKANRASLEVNQSLLQEQEKLKARLALLEAVNSNFKGGIIRFKTRNVSKHHATAVAVASDWHVEELVEADQVNGLNEYTVAIAKKRATLFFTNLVELIRKERHAVTIERLVLACLGDFFSGSIHEELLESNQLGPADAVLLAQSLLSDGLGYLLAEIPDIEILVICKSGNHGRMTHKRRIKTEDANSLEFVMYNNLAKIWAAEPRIKFDITRGIHTYVDLDGFIVRFHHGHSIKYGGGVGGITIPVNKAISQWNKSISADLDVFGHFHQYFDGGNFICNGSLIGYNEFAISIKASPEPPRQAFFLIDSKWGKTIVAPIFVEDR